MQVPNALKYWARAYRHNFEFTREIELESRLAHFPIFNLSVVSGYYSLNHRLEKVNAVLQVAALVVHVMKICSLLVFTENFALKAVVCGDANGI